MPTNIQNIMKNTLISPKKIIYFIYSPALNKNISIDIIFQIFSDDMINAKRLFGELDFRTKKMPFLKRPG